MTCTPAYLGGMRARAAIYTRISSDRDGLRAGVERQREDCLDFVRRHDLTVAEGHHFEDNDAGASTRSRKPRPSYDAMLAASEAAFFAQLKHGLTDMRALYDNDLRFLEQFG